MKPNELARNKAHPLTNKFIIAIAAITCAVLWGSAFPVLKISYVEMHLAVNNLSAKVVLAGMRFFLAAVLLFVAAVVNKQYLLVGKGNWFGVIVSSLLQISLQYFLLLEP